MLLEVEEVGPKYSLVDYLVRIRNLLRSVNEGRHRINCMGFPLQVCMLLARQVLSSAPVFRRLACALA